MMRKNNLQSHMEASQNGKGDALLPSLSLHRKKTTHPMDVSLKRTKGNPDESYTWSIANGYRFMKGKFIHINKENRSSPYYL